MTEILLDIKGIKGRLIKNAILASYSWLRVGGKADWLFIPEDFDDLACFLRQIDSEIPITVLGVGSNVLIRDGGIRGIVIRLGSWFSNIEIMDSNTVRVGAGCLDSRLAKQMAKQGYKGLEFYIGIPGTIGGALRMNAGCYGSETKDIFKKALVLDRQGRKKELSLGDMQFSYRNSRVSEDFIFIEAEFYVSPEKPALVLKRIEEISGIRHQSQPVREKTGGSTFKNPDLPESRKAWQLIDLVGGRGQELGDAMFSKQHCNFLINKGKASAFEIEQLAENIRKKVYQKTNIKLEWEIKRLGEKQGDQKIDELNV